METQTLDPQTEKKLLTAQKAEITEYLIYDKLSQSTKDAHNVKIIKDIANDELKHHNLCNKYSCQEVKPERFKVWMYYLIARIFGITFGLKLMENGEEKAHLVYEDLSRLIPDAADIALDEERHKKELIDLIDDERLNYTGDIVRGLNVALVEITGALAGLTLAFQNRNLIVTTGLILGITMALSLTSTEYLATKTGSGIKNPFKSAVYAGIVNILTIFFLLLPYMLISNIYISLGLMVFIAVIIIFLFSFYISVVKDTSTRKTFLEMSIISLGIAALAFGIGLLAKEVLHIHVI
ncbi:rubrerythrin family protein [Chloroflexota bacterium]